MALDAVLSTQTLTLMMLWLIFGNLGSLLNCDFRRMLHNRPAFFYAALFVSIMFLFAFFDTDNSPQNVGQLFLQTAALLVVFIAIVKSKWYFAVPCVMLLLADQLLRLHYASLKKGREEDDAERLEAQRKAVSDGILVAIVAVAAAGVVHYAHLQRRQHGRDFSWTSFFFGARRECNLDAGLPKHPASREKIRA